ncbi:aspartate-semialdehyde dehydrogenase [Candidatus Daviesbacteria bacterium]|nr:aspartate-semialdehyde dehydrogenase [Candidatus Daviesbacteria bacterium]
MKKIPVGILGATGMVGQRFITLLKDHPWFEVVCVAASPKSAGKKYKDAVGDRWVMDEPIPKNIANMKVLAAEEDMDQIAKQVSLVFSALDMDKDKIRKIENEFASHGVVVVSNNSAHRWTPDVPMIIPEINPDHLQLIKVQQKNHGWENGFVVVKPNCSIQSYVPLITPLLTFQPKKVMVTTLQAVSGAGKTLEGWPQMQENVIPFIGGEEEKSEKEPLKIWGNEAKGIKITATCIRVPLEDGHMASVAVSFTKKPTPSQIKNGWKNFNPLKSLKLPSSPKHFITYFEEEDRPQTRLDRDLGNGMGISVGRLREDTILDYKFVGLSHNTIRGAAGGAILTAELLKAKGYLDGKN